MDIASDAVSLQTPPRAEPSVPQGNTPFERRNVMAAAVDLATPAEIFEHLTRCAQRRRGCAVVGISAPYATAMADDAGLRDAFLSADLLIADGKGFTWGARMLGVPCGERIAIPDLCEQLLAEGNGRAWKVFIYGATEEVNSAACGNVRSRFPQLAEVAGQHGYNQGPAEEDALIERLDRERFNLLIVARPSPDKEKFLARCCKKAGVVGLAAGGYADILAGKTTRAPAIVQACGMEWAYRVMQEPGRLWKRIGVANARFAAAVLWKHLTMRPSRPFWGSRVIQAALIVLALVAAYATSIGAPFHFDDPEYIERNPTIRWRAGEDVSALATKLSQIEILSHRKVWWLSNAICFKLSDLFGVVREDRLKLSNIVVPDVRIFRAWNLACHLIAALALWALLKKCFRANGSLALGKEGQGTPWDLAAFGAAAIFVAHPLCTESVTYICGRDNGQAGMFYLLGLYFAAVAFERMGLGVPPAAPPSVPGIEAEARAVKPLSWPAWFWPLIASAACGGLAVLTKESHLTFAAAVALLYLCFFRTAGKGSTVSVGLLLGIAASAAVIAWGAGGRWDGYLSTAAQLSILLIGAGAVLGMRHAGPLPAWRRSLTYRVRAAWAFLIAFIGLGAASIIAFPYAYLRVFAALSGFQDSSYVRSLCSQAYAVPWMLLRGIAPFGLNIDHDFPTISSFDDPRAQTGAVIIATLVIIGLIGLWKRSLLGFAILLALLYIAPSNSIIERGDIVSERNFFLVAACGAMLMVWLAATLTSWIASRLDDASEAAHPQAAKNRSLRNLREGGLWAGVLSICVAGPFSALTVVRNADWSDPYRLWGSAAELSPYKLRVLYNFGIASIQRKDYENAETSFNKAITTGELKAEKGLFRPDEAVEVKCFHLAYANLATIYLSRYMKGDRSDATLTVTRVDEIYKRGMERTAYDPDLAY
ncbi:MAG TPA: WecB/TagA/CpsF family glycosyltransferase, partial [Planctomycetota bacterium]|nr:WecB/TagA/CpsF family glycosyltransferase [Planctomycetota bacterium]